MVKACHINATPNWKDGISNWGDKALVYAGQKLFTDKFGDTEWSSMTCRKIYTEADVEFINTHEFLLVGGGGLILPDTFENDVSGWQWGISNELLEKITIPIIVHAIGWNLFDGQKNNDKLLRPSLKLLAEKAEFISLRHSADVKLFNEYVGSDKAVLNYCPTVTMGEFKPNTTRRVGINIAGDRMDVRYKDQRTVFGELLTFIKFLKRNDYEPVIVNHMPLDIPFGYYVRDHFGIDMVDMSKMTVKEGIKFYRGLEYMYATRGHAQMVPFGLGVKVVSLISHPKLARFLADMLSRGTGIDINHSWLAKQCVDRMSAVRHFDFYTRRVAVDELMNKNMEIIKDRIFKNETN